MTFDAAGDLARHIRFQADYDDGSSDAFAIPQGTLQQGDAPTVLRTIAHEWQNDGFIKAGRIVSVRPKQFAQH
jgi:hypothetical protein